MNFSKRNTLLHLAFAITALFISACASQQSAESKPVVSNSVTQQATTQPNPPAPPKPGAEQNTAVAPISKETEVEISLPVTEAAAAAVGSTVTIPIAINSKSDKEIFSYSLAVMFDPKVLQPTDEPISTTGTLSSGFTVVSDTKTSGRLGIAAATTGKTVKTNGNLLNTHFKVIGKGSGKMDLKIAQPVFEDSSGNALNVNAAVKQ